LSVCQRYSAFAKGENQKWRNFFKNGADSTKSKMVSTVRLVENLALKKKQVVGEIVCSSCKRKIPANNILCPYCRNMVGTGKAKTKNKSNVNGWAIAAIILSGGLVGFILGIIGYNKSTETGRGRGLSLAAIVISILGMILGAVLPIILYSRGGVFDNLLGLYS
jgi:hypothetical protein